jgi:hypothetical protein
MTILIFQPTQIIQPTQIFQPTQRGTTPERAEQGVSRAGRAAGGSVPRGAPTARLRAPSP